MKALRKALLASVVVIFTAQVHAVMYLARPYEPSMARWITRDPIGERGFELTAEKKSSLWAGGPNRYLFCANNAVSNVDPLGLDIWIMSDCSGLIKHRTVVGKNADGTYWSADFMPDAKSLFGRLCCKGTISFTKNQLILTPDSSSYCVERHEVVSQEATDDAREYASGLDQTKRGYRPGSYAGAYDCRDFAREIADYAKRKHDGCYFCKSGEEHPPKSEGAK